MDANRLKKRIEYSGLIKGVPFEICHREPDPHVIELMGHDKDKWTFYLFLNVDQMPAEKQKEFWLDPVLHTSEHSGKVSVSHAYSDSPGINAIEWHCGCTFYEKYGFEGGSRGVNIGCDFMHYWDEGREYNLESVLSEVKIAIDSFWEYMPDYKVHCSGNGKYYKASEGKFKDGYFTSDEWSKKRAEELATTASAHLAKEQ